MANGSEKDSVPEQENEQANAPLSGADTGTQSEERTEEREDLQAEREEALVESEDDDMESPLPFDEHEEIVSEGGRKIRRRGIFLLPNLMTLGALFSGFYAIIAGMNGNFNEAGWAVLVAAVFDGLDGRVARLTNTQSAFGAQFDSLSDMVSFGMAPALIVFSWALSGLGTYGWAACFVYMSCAALRLARFNVQLGTVDKRYFVGLQSPVAAGLVTFVPWVATQHGVEVTEFIAILMALLTFMTGVLMVSNYRYLSFKEMHFKGTVPYVVFLLLVVLLVIIAQNPHETLLAMSVVYAASGPAIWLYKRQRRHSRAGLEDVVKAGADAEQRQAERDAPKAAGKPTDTPAPDSPGAGSKSTTPDRREG